MSKRSAKLPFRIWKNRFASPSKVQQILTDAQQDAFVQSRSLLRSRKKPAYLTGTYKGNYYRIKVSKAAPVLPNVPRLPTGQNVPRPFKSVPPPPQPPPPSTLPLSTSTKSTTFGWKQQQQQLQIFASWKQQYWHYYTKLFKEWWYRNWPILILNFGSVCTLIGFTRSDILELRALSVCGSLSSVVFQKFSKPTQWFAVYWSTIFATINSYKIYQILEERNSSVRLTSEQEEIFVQYFMPQGVTPKQFDRIYQKAKILVVKQNHPIVLQGEKLEGVYLVVKGKTRASVLGRRLSAASTTPSLHDERVSEVPGAWIGEIAFLEQYWVKEQDSKQTEEKVFQKAASVVQTKKQTNPTNGEKVVNLNARDSKSEKPALTEKRTVKYTPYRNSELKASRALYTVTAVNGDCTVLWWSYADMEELLAHSADMRAAMTRAMTAAIVGKVINFTISKGNSKLPWADSWLINNFKSIKGESGSNVEETSSMTTTTASNGEELEDLPFHPIKKFRPTNP